jgi:TctA family transporter
VLRGTALGSVLGVLPGGRRDPERVRRLRAGETLVEHPEQFGRGRSKAWRARIRQQCRRADLVHPMLTLGIPGNAVMALMIGALTIHGIQPGPQIMSERPGMFWG